MRRSLSSGVPGNPGRDGAGRDGLGGREAGATGRNLLPGRLPPSFASYVQARMRGWILAHVIHSELGRLLK